MEPRHFKPYPRLSPHLLRDEVSGKTVLITGGGYGIGLAIANSFAEAGVHSIILVGRTESKLKSSAEHLASLYNDVKVTYITADIASNTDTKRLFDALSTSPEILVNNAGYLAAPSNFIDADLTDYWDAFKINVLGSIQITQAFLRHRRNATTSTTPTTKTPATIVNMNTVGAYSVHVPSLSSYGASKAAFLRWSELISDDIPVTEARFISVHPGYIRTDMAAKSGLEGVFEPTEVKLAGDFVVWLASAEAEFLAGRFVWVNWDVEELVARKGDILEKDLLRSDLRL
ncbi:hypothetical protein BDW59DRAFT_173921 [Aspergillus cavernicola]|uniref:NAD(P)-binding protein n=1 Tax=Aspergillus cavernicola TaxID=176166 RepID=A0ABR4I3K6_9EURO